MVTKEEFVAAMDVVENCRKEMHTALNVVDGYHEQLREDITLAEKQAGVPIREFIRNVEISARLRTALESVLEYGGQRVVCLEEIDEYIFLRLRNSGRISWNEFSEKRDQYLQERKQISSEM